MECPDCGSNLSESARFCMACGTMVARFVPVTANVMPEAWVAAHSQKPQRQPKLNDRYLGTAARVPRLIAWLIDGMIVTFAGLLYVGLLGIEIISPDDPFFQGRANSPQINWEPFVPLWIAQAAYYIAFPATPWMGTPGKKLFRLSITDCDGDRIGIFQSALRYFWQCVILWLIVPIAMIFVPFGIVIVPVTLLIFLAPKYDQSPWDMLAGTRVLE